MIFNSLRCSAADSCRPISLAAARLSAIGNSGKITDKKKFTFPRDLWVSSKCNMFPARPAPPTAEVVERALRATVDVAHEAKLAGKHPFGCVLLSPENEILLKQGNIDTLNHAEMTMCREAFARFDVEYLWRCTLVTNFEPCLMCFGAIYWSNIGRVIFGLTELQLLQLTGSAAENMTFDLSCKDVVKHGQKDIEIFGPFEEYQDAIVADHLEFWT